jgi:hypothetical protein
MRYIIALEGLPNRGKSSTFRILYEKLLTNNYRPVRRKRSNSDDFSIVFYKFGIAIGITSYGDTPDLILMKLNIFVEANCIILLCACRGNDATKQTVENFPDSTKEFILKTEEMDEVKQGAANEKDAEKLLNQIENMVNEKTLFIQDKIQTYLGEKNGWKTYISEKNNDIDDATLGSISDVTLSGFDNGKYYFDVQIIYDLPENSGKQSDSNGFVTFDENWNITEHGTV